MARTGETDWAEPPSLGGWTVPPTDAFGVSRVLAVLDGVAAVVVVDCSSAAWAGSCAVISGAATSRAS